VTGVSLSEADALRLSLTWSDRFVLKAAGEIEERAA
jgi:hypothetical protein